MDWKLLCDPLAIAHCSLPLWGIAVALVCFGAVSAVIYAHQAREIRRMQYELPGASAAMVKSRLQNVRKLLELRDNAMPRDPHLTAMVHEIEAAYLAIEHWQENSQALTNYEFARKAVDDEQ